jgi:hypothetical protein
MSRDLISVERDSLLRKPPVQRIQLQGLSCTGKNVPKVSHPPPPALMSLPASFSRSHFRAIMDRHLNFNESYHGKPGLLYELRQRMSQSRRCRRLTCRRRQSSRERQLDNPLPSLRPD